MEIFELNELIAGPVTLKTMLTNWITDDSLACPITPENPQDTNSARHGYPFLAYVDAWIATRAMFFLALASKEGLDPTLRNKLTVAAQEHLGVLKKKLEKSAEIVFALDGQIPEFSSDESYARGPYGQLHWIPFLYHMACVYLGRANVNPLPKI